VRRWTELSIVLTSWEAFTEAGVTQSRRECCDGVLIMKTHALLIAGSLLFGFAGAAVAADHLHQAEVSTGGKITHDFAESNPGVGQGSPFSGEDRGIPATDTQTNAHQFGNDFNLPGKANPPSAEPLPSADLK
jgi:hypothetical protein